MNLLLNNKIFVIGVIFFVAFCGYIIDGLIDHRIKTSPEHARLAGEGIPIRVAKVEKGGLESFIGTEGVVEGSSVVSIRSRIVGQVSHVNAELGQLVEKGQVLIEFDPTLQQADLVEAEVQLNSFSQGYTRSKQIFEKTRELFNKKLFSEDELIKAESELRKARYELAKAKNKKVHKREDRNSTTIKSPITGIVTLRDIHPGVLPKPFLEMMEIVALDPVLVESELSEEKIQMVHVGQKAEVSFYAYPDRKYEGSVLRIDPVVDLETRNFSVKVLLNNSDLKLRPGLRGIVRLARQDVERLKIPSIALVSNDGVSGNLFVVKDDVAHFRTVKLGLSSQGYVLVKEGLNIDEMVVIVGQVALKDGDKVRIGDEFTNNVKK